MITSTSPTRGDVSVPTSTSISATFTDPMDVATVNGTTFTASSPAGPLTGTVTCVDLTATLHPDAVLPDNTLITATITKGVRALNGKKLAAAYEWTFTTGNTTDTTLPTVSSTDPTAGQTGVVLNKEIIATFSEPMAASSVTDTTFTVSGPGGAVNGVVTLLNNVATFKPAANLTATTLYTATISTGATDLSGNGLAIAKIWTFTTGATVDSTAPTILSTDPAANASGVPTNKKVSATFSETMDPATINVSTFRLKKSGVDVAATVAYANKIATLSPSSALTANSVYTAIISTGAKDSASNALATEKTWSFTTAADGDLVPPTVMSTNPADKAQNVFLNASVNATFSEAMRSDTLNTSNFRVLGVTGTVSYDTLTHIATFTPTSDLLPNSTYTARIETGAQDSAGNGLATAEIWSFTTGVQRSQTGIDLGSASTYAVLAGSTVTNAGPTIINGDLGVSPGTAVTGFPPGTVNGAIHAGDAAAAQAKTDLLAAQLDASGRLGGLVLAGDLSGLTFTPGLYKNSTSVMLSSGNVTLDAQGDANAIFIFQMGSTLTTSAGTQVILAGGAQAKNIYWSVGSSATLGVNSIFNGNILAEVSITVNTGAVNNGTLLTKTGAVTLQANTITRSHVSRH